MEESSSDILSLWLWKATENFRADLTVLDILQLQSFSRRLKILRLGNCPSELPPSLSWKRAYTIIFPPGALGKPPLMQTLQRECESESKC